MKKLMLAFATLGLFGLAACQPTVKLEAPSEPIVINLNVKIEQEVLVRLQRDVEQLIQVDPYRVLPDRDVVIMDGNQIHFLAPSSVIGCVEAEKKSLDCVAVVGLGKVVLNVRVWGKRAIVGPP